MQGGTSIVSYIPAVVAGSVTRHTRKKSERGSRRMPDHAQNKRVATISRWKHRGDAGDAEKK